MKKILLLVLTSVLFWGCKNENNLQGWLIDNQSNQTIDFYLSGQKFSVSSKSDLKIDNMTGNEDVSISDDYHVNYEISYYYNKNEGNRKWLRISDKIQYKYSITNSYNSTVSFKVNDTVYEIENGTFKDFIFYDSPVEFHFFSSNYEIPFTHNYKDGIHYIYIFNELNNL